MPMKETVTMHDDGLIYLCMDLYGHMMITWAQMNHEYMDILVITHLFWSLVHAHGWQLRAVKVTAFYSPDVHKAGNMMTKDPFYEHWLTIITV